MRIISLGPWTYQRNKYFYSVGGQFYRASKYNGYHTASVGYDNVTNKYYVVRPELEVYLEPTDTPEILMFKLDLLLLEEGYEMEDPFVFPEEVAILEN